MRSKKANVKIRRRIHVLQVVEKSGSSGWTRTNNRPVNRWKKKHQPPFAVACWSLPNGASSVVESGYLLPSLCSALCCRLLLLVAPKGQEKGNVPRTLPPRDNRVLAKDNSLRKLASSGSLSVALNRFAAHSPHARLRAASRAASRPSAVRSSGNAQHLRRQHFHYLHLRLVKASTRKATPSEHISMRGHTTIRRQQ